MSPDDKTIQLKQEKETCRIVMQEELAEINRLKGLIESMLETVDRSTGLSEIIELQSKMELSVNSLKCFLTKNNLLDLVKDLKFEISRVSSLNTVCHVIKLYLTDSVEIVRTDEEPPTKYRRCRINDNCNDSKVIINIDLLGCYFPAERLIKLYWKNICECADDFNFDLEVLAKVVELHEAGHAVVHLGKDADSRQFELDDFNNVDSGVNPSPLHETLAQLLTYHSIKVCTSDHKELLDCFMELNRCSSQPYRCWESFKYISIERVRVALVMMRTQKIKAEFGNFSLILQS